MCALPIELAAAQVLLDEEHRDLERDPADENLYALNSISGHNVAGRIGNNSGIYGIILILYNPFPWY